MRRKAHWFQWCSRLYHYLHKQGTRSWQQRDRPRRRALRTFVVPVNILNFNHSALFTLVISSSWALRGSTKNAAREAGRRVASTKRAARGTNAGIATRRLRGSVDIATKMKPMSIRQLNRVVETTFRLSRKCRVMSRITRTATATCGKRRVCRSKRQSELVGCSLRMLIRTSFLANFVQN